MVVFEQPVVLVSGVVVAGWVLLDRDNVSGLPIFGAFEDRTAGTGLVPAAPRLKVNATVVFGVVMVAKSDL